ncbi:MAG TPA: CHAT domain-containing protein, partial [Flavobacteriales bacterium]|nr:CHAT domain-containing protein [Flavobacteriales bacterium]
MAWTDSAIYAFGVYPDTVSFQRIAVNASVRSAIDALSSADHLSDNARVTEASQDLGEALFVDLKPPITANTVMILDGPLTKVPFDLVSISNGASTPKILADVTNVRYEYGIDLIEGATAPTTPGDIFTLAPSFHLPSDESASSDPGKNTNLLTALPSVRSKLGPLTFNMIEVGTIMELADGDRLEGERISEEDVWNKIAGKRILHFATHAICDNEHPGLSAILVRDPLPNGTSSNEDDDGLLHAYEIQRKRLGADLVVLSACETSLGKEQKGEGPMSLARAFKYAACSNIVSSLWKVDDLATKEIMVKFYEKLGEGMGKADALAEAKRWYRRTYPNEPPSKWAAFILIGDNEPVHLKKREPMRPWMWG